MARILIIDDDEQLRLMLRLTLQRGGHEVQEAANGEDGLNAHREEPADLIVCDLYMPEKEGLETIREMRARFPTVKIIAMSGGTPKASEDLLPLAQAFGAAATLKKPFKPSTLLDLIAKILGSK